jgi:putative hydrolase of the HAD superfamily
MNHIYLFDWGDTLMVDFDDEAGKMCDWSKVQAVDGAEEVLHYLSKQSDIYIATNAEDSTELDIQKALERVDLAKYVSGYFCKANLGVSKGSVDFYQRIAAKLRVLPQQLTMVGDSYEKDIEPAIQAGLNAVWLRDSTRRGVESPKFKCINGLRELCI